MYKILIAEDESEMRNLIVKYLNTMEPEFQVVGSAVNGLDALKLAESLRPDIVLTDISMPVMDGLEFIREAGQRNLPLKAVIISGYDEFDYARRAISMGVADYLLKPFDPEELRNVLDKIKRELDKQANLFENMRRLREKADEKGILLKEQILKGILLGKEDVREPEKWVLDVEAEFFCVCLLKLPLYPDARGWNLERQENVEELVKILSGGYIHRDIEAHGLGYEGNGAVLILAGSAGEKEQFLRRVKSGMEHLIQSMERHYSIRVVCVIGTICSHWRELHGSYEEVISSWKGITSADKGLIVCGRRKEGKTQEAGKSEKDSSRAIKALKEQILLSIRMGQERESREYLEELMETYGSILPDGAEFASISARELVYSIFNEIARSHIRLDAACTNEEIESQVKGHLEHASLMEIGELLRHYFPMFHRAFLENRDRQQGDVIVENVRELIENNLDLEGLTLEWIAGKLNFSSAYIRQIFKQKTGEAIMEYVIRKRMEKAGRLLMNTDMRIQEVAKACGYGNQRYFASSFKKYYECTPSNFKRNVNTNG